MREEALRQELTAAIEMYQSELERRVELQSKLLTAEATIRRLDSALRQAGVPHYYAL